MVSTLRTGVSKWLRIDVPHRLERLTGARVHHVETAPPRAEPAISHREERSGHSGLLAPLAALPWGSPHRREQ